MRNELANRSSSRSKKKMLSLPRRLLVLCRSRSSSKKKTLASRERGHLRRRRLPSFGAILLRPQGLKSKMT
jgi:hypothetical protein